MNSKEDVRAFYLPSGPGLPSREYMDLTNGLCTNFSIIMYTRVDGLVYSSFHMKGLTF
jgi:hypothetical protein